MRAKIDADTLLQIILVLVIVWLVLAILNATVDLVTGIFGLLPNIIGLAIAILIVLWLLDRI